MDFRACGWYNAGKEPRNGREESHMRRNNQYVLTTIEDHFYLLPIGQCAADMHRYVQLNETGVFLWNLLENDLPEDVIIHECCAHYGRNEWDYDFHAIIHDFLEKLLLRGIVRKDEMHFSIRKPYVKSISIGGLVCSLYGDAGLFHPNLDAFVCPPHPNPDQYVEILTDAPSAVNGTVILRHENLWVMCTDDRYILLFPNLTTIREVHLLQNATCVQIYCHPAGESLMREEIFHVFRHAFLCLAQCHNMVAIHSASILYRDRAWLFSAPSGVGKSTQAALWNETMHTPILNGDLNLIADGPSGPIVFGLPWCGTSDLYTAFSYPLGGILFLKQSSADNIVHLSIEKRILSFQSRLISPVWTREQLEHNCRFAAGIARQTFLAELQCTPTVHAVTTARSAMDLC